MKMILRVPSRMIERLGYELSGCWRCGFLPIRLDYSGTKGKMFSYACPNEACEEVWKSPSNESWKPNKKEATDYWNQQQRKL